MKRAIPSVVIGFAASGVFTYALVHAMKIGTCASGGAYLSARPGTSGTGGWILLLTGGILIAVIAMVIGSGTRASVPTRRSRELRNWSASASIRPRFA